MSSPSTNRLDGILAKIERANDHIQDLERRLLSFRATGPYGLRVEKNPESGERIYRVEIRASIPPVIPILAGEILYHLRTTLDHLVWQLVEANGNTPDNQTAFPIFETEAKYKTRSPRKVQGICPTAISVIDALKPYQGGNDSFWKLHHLNNIDKHHFVLITAFGGGVPTYRWVVGGPVKKQAKMITFTYLPGLEPGKRFAMLQDGAEIGSTTDSTKAENDMDFDLPFEIAFGEPQIVEGQAILPLLGESTCLVKNVIDQLASFL